MGQKGCVCHKAKCCFLVLLLPQMREIERKNLFGWKNLCFVFCFFPKGKSIHLFEHLSVKEMIAWIFHLPQQKTLKLWPCMHLFICWRFIVCCSSEVKLSSNPLVKSLMIQRYSLVAAVTVIQVSPVRTSTIAAKIYPWLMCPALWSSSSFNNWNFHYLFPSTLI